MFIIILIIGIVLQEKLHEECKSSVKKLALSLLRKGLISPFGGAKQYTQILILSLEFFRLASQLWNKAYTHIIGFHVVSTPGLTRGLP